MTDRLDLEKCKYLAEVGLQQGIVTGDWYWSTDHHGEWCRFYFNYAPSREYYKIPDLETLMEFAKTLDANWILEPIYSGWRICFEDSLKDTINEEHPILAVYKLIEKLVEVTRGDK